MPLVAGGAVQVGRAVEILCDAASRGVQLAKAKARFDFTPVTRLLEQHGVQVVNAENGMEAICLLDQDQDIDAVLMDIMMPEMDGYETMRRIRLNSKHRLLPILALTAKAMKGDREKCLDAGASDYIAKPVNAEELLALLRIWLFGKKRMPRASYEYRADS